jgi:hypothetical protein
LSAGTYILTVEDATGCIIVVSATVNNNTGTLAISNAVLQDANCISPSGFIDLTILVVHLVIRISGATQQRLKILPD